MSLCFYTIADRCPRCKTAVLSFPQSPFPDRNHVGMSEKDVFNRTITTRISEVTRAALDKERERLSKEQKVSFSLSDVVRRAVLIYLETSGKRR